MIIGTIDLKKSFVTNLNLSFQKIKQNFCLWLFKTEKKKQLFNNKADRVIVHNSKLVKG